VADFEPISVLGMMSGTSLDGVDGAVVRTDGEGVLEFGQTGFRAYEEGEREVLRSALGSWPSERLKTAQEIVLNAHAEVAADLNAELIGFHGQTLAHDPAGARTHQLGDGARLAQLTGRDVVWDFRTDDMEMGGQGAPLAPFYHHALARHLGLSEPVAFLNLGGVGNVSWVNPSVPSPQEKRAICAFDTGPANALLDDFLLERTGQAFDQAGALAAEGRVPDDFLSGLNEQAYFAKPPPKSLDRNDFSGYLKRVSRMNSADGAASLTALSSACVALSVSHLPARPQKWLVSGGGRHNATMMAMLRNDLEAPVEAVEAFGLNGDMLEAQAFAWLAVRVLRGLPTSSPDTTGCHGPVSGGKFSKA